MKDKIYFLLPDFLQGLLISLFNFFAYKKRYGGKYKAYLEVFKHNRQLSLADLTRLQKERYSKFILQAISKSAFYGTLYSSIESCSDLANIAKLPIVNKELFRKDIKAVYAIDKKDGIVSKTGGTTGKSLEVLFTDENMQERFAMLDDFRGRFGYKLGEKTAWFSGKNLLTNGDIRKNRFWKTDLIYKIRYYSTFHIKESYLGYYVADLIKYKPKYLVGFPSTILDIAKYGLKHKIDFPANTVIAVFPTAETVTKETKDIIESFFKTSVYDQYASSEGAPFIFECNKRNLHLELQSGVFEVLDDNDNYTNSGRLIVTSFTTDGTPLIRYDIGDNIELSDAQCDCGNHNPLVKQILGRIDDYIYSPEIGKINLGNVSNTLKDTKGIVKFQAIQDDLNKVVIKVVIDPAVFDKKSEDTFLSNWIARVGKKMTITVEFVDDIPVEKSGKYRIVKNTIKHLVEQAQA
jgi:phenylacetate-CoA ligase